MDVLPNEEEQMIRNSAREFFEAECPTSLVREMEKDDQGYSRELWSKMSEVGWLSLVIPEAYGGSGFGMTTLGIVMAETGRVLAPVPFHSTMTAALAISSFGTEQQKHDILPLVADGNQILTWAFTEEDPRYLPETIHTTGEVQGDKLIVNGTKMFVDNFEAADQILIVCRTSNETDPQHGLTVFIADANDSAFTNIPLTTIAKDKQSRIEINNLSVSIRNIIGEIGDGWTVISEMLDKSTALLCAQLVGAARKDSEIAIDYAKNRTAFGRPIAAFQSVSHMCADMTIWVDGCELLTFESLWKMDQGLPYSIEVSQAKSFCNEKCLSTARTSQVIHGGMGFMMEFDLHLWYRRIAAWTMRLGTTYEHRKRIASALIAHDGPVRLGMNLEAAKT
tara:strand:+ start:5954 stop:7132 length:1179 start_codon:yes stop_codon:yes gene_type:complete